VPAPDGADYIVPGLGVRPGKFNFWRVDSEKGRKLNFQGLTPFALGGDGLGPEIHHLRDEFARLTPDRTGPLQMKRGTYHMCLPFHTRQQAVELGGFPLDQKEPIHISAMRIQKNSVKRLDRPFLLQSAEVLDELPEVLGAHALTSGDRTVPPEKNHIRTHRRSSFVDGLGGLPEKPCAYTSMMADAPRDGKPFDGGHSIHRPFLSEPGSAASQKEIRSAFEGVDIRGGAKCCTINHKIIGIIENRHADATANYRAIAGASM
jgi:hypothetical protein